ncbi:STAS domain-containing protein [Nonomuraea sp. GTA35]|uniref:STAS domain-containing protein n=1 Tax=Nonomuraea sp. GTA35 TaxID=1676746 RepID=UPI0035BFFC8F
MGEHSQVRIHEQVSEQEPREGQGRHQQRREELAIVVVWQSAVCPVIALRGELGAATAADLVREVDRVLADQPAAVVVDLSRLAFCDFEGVGALIGAHRRARRLGGELVLAGAQGRCARLLRRTGLDHVFPQLPSQTQSAGTGKDMVRERPASQASGGGRCPSPVTGT